MNEREYPLFPELNEEGKRQAQELMLKFEKVLKEKAFKVIEEFSTDFYCNILHEIESDHWANYRSKILNGMSNYGNKNESKYDFDRIRKSIYKNHKEEIVKDLNQDLLKEIEDLKKELARSYSKSF